MKTFGQMNRDELILLKSRLEKEYEDIQKQGLVLNMARGKPDWNQVSLSMKMLDTLNSSQDYSDCKEYFNYGILDGIDEAKTLFSEILNVSTDNIIVYGNSSLNIMFDQISRAFTHGYMGNKPWGQLEKVKFLCPVPGYDRHFAITEYFHIEMIPIPFDNDGPNMDVVQQYVESDESVKGIWCVPQYSNPTGITYSDKTVERFANLNPAAKDFRIFWDNAYILHHLYNDKQDCVGDILSACEKAGHPDIVFEFCSTSKVSFPGAGVAAMATSINNKNDILKHMNIQGIGFDKLNQLRHVQYYKDINGLKLHMQKHAELLRPKFELVLDILKKELGGLDIAKWTQPLGGYFIAFDGLDGCAKQIVKKCKEAGAILTAAGAPFPYGNDPRDSHIRIAPSYPEIEELRQAAYLFTLCVKLVSIDKYLEK
ncbi:MAG: aminotransferase class I/II-fold pyridoxal phosphate-dependent enzyme [Coprobacillus sp.]